MMIGHSNFFQVLLSTAVLKINLFEQFRDFSI